MMKQSSASSGSSLTAVAEGLLGSGRDCNESDDGYMSFCQSCTSVPPELDGDCGWSLETSGGDGMAVEMEGGDGGIIVRCDDSG
jgi:hypothetical protein